MMKRKSKHTSITLAKILSLNTLLEEVKPYALNIMQGKLSKIYNPFTLNIQSLSVSNTKHADGYWLSEFSCVI